jgi:hypothetical protein
MKNKRYLTLLAALASTPVFAAPFLAIGDNAELFLTANASARYEDNIDFSEDNETSDVISEFSPGLELAFGKNSLVRGSFSVYEKFIAYADNSEFNDELFNALFKSSYSGANFQLASNASFRELNQTTRDVQAIIESTEIEAGVNGEVSLTSKTKVGLGLQYLDRDYKPTGLLDRTTYTVPANYFFAISPKVDLSAGVRYRNTDVDAADSDSESYNYNVGARGQFTAKLSGSFNVGFTHLEQDSAGSSSLPGFDAGLVYAYSPKTSFRLDLSNDFDTAAVALPGSQGSQKIASATFGGNTQISPAFSLNSSATYQNIEYLNTATDREDDFIVFTVGAGYIVTQRLSLSAYYSYKKNVSDQAAAEFDANTVGLSANFRY